MNSRIVAPGRVMMNGQQEVILQKKIMWLVLLGVICDLFTLSSVMCGFLVKTNTVVTKPLTNSIHFGFDYSLCSQIMAELA